MHPLKARHAAKNYVIFKKDGTYAATIDVFQLFSSTKDQPRGMKILLNVYTAYLSVMDDM